jgi:flagellar assembly protein FliH
MSSKILQGPKSTTAQPLDWRQVRREGGEAAAPAESPLAGELPAAPEWGAYNALENRLREVEQHAPARERQARLAGFEEGHAAAAAEWQPALERAARSAVEIAGLRSRLRREAEEEVVRLSIAIARRILRREMNTDQDALLGLVKAALERIELRETHRLRVRPEDAPLMRALLDRIGSPHRVEVVADAALERGAAIFETERGNLDASVSTQLEEIERGFTELLQRKPD